MALNNYMSGLQTKMLHQVVMPGAHDAGIYDRGQISGTGLTQDLNIFQQACFGVRWFDIRIAGELVSGQVQLKAFHKAMSKKKTQGGLQYLDGGFGGYGGRLDDMLTQARDFLIQNPSEVLFFRISKSQNVATIYQRCVQVLGAYLYKAAGTIHNLNERQVSQLSGTLVALFSESDAVLIRQDITSRATGAATFAATQTVLEEHDGVFSFGELFGSNGKAKPYKAQYRGLQYFGKFSQTNYFGTNKSKQTKNMKKANKSLGPSSKNVLGMMYWTLTSSVGNLASLPVNIEKRNKKLWTDRHVADLTNIWKGGMEDSIRNHMGHARYDFTTQSHEWNGFIPNIVMLDFANPTACGTIVNLNTVRSDVINQLVNNEWNDG